jgi:hypothetical protein
MGNTIKIHSIVDLITNSSTVIYTYSEDSGNHLKIMMEEIIKVFGINESFDNMFELDLKTEKNEEDEEDEEYGGDDCRPSTYLELTAKDEKYKDLASKIMNFLYSVDNDAERDG